MRRCSMRMQAALQTHLVCSGFCRDSILSWCEDNNVDCIIGLSKNKRLTKIIGGELHQAQQQFTETGHAARVFKDFHYRTKKSWSRERRVVIRSTGGWGELWHQATDDVHTHVGFGIGIGFDNPHDSDLSVGRRSQNHFWSANVVHDVTELFSVGLEVSYWKTKFVGLADGEAVRIETVMKYRF